MIREKSGVKFHIHNIISYSKAKLQKKKVKHYLFLAYSCVQINAHSTVWYHGDGATFSMENLESNTSLSHISGLE